MRLENLKTRGQLEDGIRKLFMDEAAWVSVSKLQQPDAGETAVHYPPLEHSHFNEGLANASQIIASQKMDNPADHLVVAEILADNAHLDAVVQAVKQFMQQHYPDSCRHEEALEFDECIKGQTVTQTYHVEKTAAGYGAVHVLLHNSARVGIASRLKVEEELSAEERAEIDAIFTSPEKWKVKGDGVQTVRYVVNNPTPQRVQSVKNYIHRRMGDGAYLLGQDTHFRESHCRDHFAPMSISWLTVQENEEKGIVAIEITLDPMSGRGIAADILRQQVSRRAELPDNQNEGRGI